MKNLLYSLLLLILVSGCSSPQKLYEKGKYDKAFDSVLSDLKQNKNRKNKTLLNKSFSKLIDSARDKMIDIKNGYDVSDLISNLEEYYEVDQRYKKGKVYLDSDNITKYEKLNIEKHFVLDVAYEEGKSLMKDFEESGNKFDARNAYYHFSLIDEYGDRYEGMDQYLLQSYEAATLVYNVVADLDYDYSYKWDVDRQFDNLEGKEKFVKIVYDSPSNIGDCLIELDFSRLDEDIRTRSDSRSYNKEIIDGYTTVTDTSGRTREVPIYKTVKGEVITKRVTKTVAWRVDIEIRRSSSNCNLRERRFYADEDDSVEEYEIRGDTRAIPSQYFNNNNKSYLEKTDDMVDDILDDLYREIRDYLYNQ